jgi:hypothetical protein
MSLYIDMCICGYMSGFVCMYLCVFVMNIYTYYRTNI